MVLISLSADVLHHGHTRLIRRAVHEFGAVTVALLSDRAIIEGKNRPPLLGYLQRKEMVSDIRGVETVVEQDAWDDAILVRKLRPKVVIHGDDWNKTDSGRVTKGSVIAALQEYGGKLVEYPSAEDVPKGLLESSIVSIGQTASVRQNVLNARLAMGEFIRICEAHSPVSALVVESIRSDTFPDHKFHGFWSSSLTDSTLLGLPDIEILDYQARLSQLRNIFNVSTLPCVFDGDTGGKIEHFEKNARSLALAGISVVIIEDKTGLKKNSLLSNSSIQTLEDPLVFGEKIKVGKEASAGTGMSIYARLESFIAGKDLADAMKRAEVYVDHDVDGIMIHSREKDPSQVASFASAFRKEFGSDIPLVCVPTSYNHVTESELVDMGFNMVIYANQLMRSSIGAMQESVKTILNKQSSIDLDEKIISVGELLKFIPGTAE